MIRIISLIFTTLFICFLMSSQLTARNYVSSYGLNYLAVINSGNYLVVIAPSQIGEKENNFIIRSYSIDAEYLTPISLVDEEMIAVESGEKAELSSIPITSGLSLWIVKGTLLNQGGMTAFSVDMSGELKIFNFAAETVSHDMDGDGVAELFSPYLHKRPVGKENYYFDPIASSWQLIPRPYRELSNLFRCYKLDPKTLTLSYAGDIIISAFTPKE